MNSEQHTRSRARITFTGACHRHLLATLKSIIELITAQEKPHHHYTVGCCKKINLLQATLAPGGAGAR